MGHAWLTEAEKAERRAALRPGAKWQIAVQRRKGVKTWREATLVEVGDSVVVYTFVGGRRSASDRGRFMERHSTLPEGAKEAPAPRPEVGDALQGHVRAAVLVETGSRFDAIARRLDTIVAKQDALGVALADLLRMWRT